MNRISTTQKLIQKERLNRMLERAAMLYKIVEDCDASIKEMKLQLFNAQSLKKQAQDYIANTDFLTKPECVYEWWVYNPDLKLK